MAQECAEKGVSWPEKEGGTREGMRRRRGRGGMGAESSREGFRGFCAHLPLESDRCLHSRLFSSPIGPAFPRYDLERLFHAQKYEDATRKIHHTPPSMDSLSFPSTTTLGPSGSRHISVP